MSDGVPQFRLLSQEHRPRSFFESLSILWESDPRVSPLRLNSAQAWPRERRATAAVFASLLLHFAVGLFY